MAKVTQHPVFGRLIPDQWGDDLIFFRKFPELTHFWQPNSQKQLEDLESKDRQLVKNWEQQPGELPQISRNFDVLAALQSLGVYEVGMSSPEEGDVPLPMPGQIATWEYFLSHEQHICQNASQVLVRYFNHLREVEPELFVDETDCPEVAEICEDLQSCVRFDGMNLSADSPTGRSILSMGWDVDWDLEHGLQMIFFEDQVIALGNDLYAPEDISSESNFLIEIMNEEEQSALEKFLSEMGE